MANPQSQELDHPFDPRYILLPFAVMVTASLQWLFFILLKTLGLWGDLGTILSGYESILSWCIFVPVAAYAVTDAVNTWSKKGVLKFSPCMRPMNFITFTLGLFYSAYGYPSLVKPVDDMQFVLVSLLMLQLMVKYRMLYKGNRWLNELESRL